MKGLKYLLIAGVVLLVVAVGVAMWRTPQVAQQQTSAAAAEGRAQVTVQEDTPQVIEVLEDAATAARTMAQDVTEGAAAAVDSVAGAANPLLAGVQPELRITNTDLTLGDPNAPVQIVEYLSMTCSHCANFHLNQFPKLKEEYIDTGKVYMAVRHFPFDPLAFAVGKITHCAGERFPGYIKAFMETQRSWAQAEDIMAEIKKIARLGGMSNEQVDACLENEEIHQRVAEKREVAAQTLAVRATPTFFVNGRRMEGVQIYETLAAQIDSQLAIASGEAVPEEDDGI